MVLAAVALVAVGALGGVAAERYLNDDATSEDRGYRLDVTTWGRIDACPTHPNPHSPPTSHCPTIAQLEVYPGNIVYDAEELCVSFLERAGVIRCGRTSAD